jgi:hypothetical protein
MTRTKPNVDMCTRQVMRLAQLGKFPADPEDPQPLMDLVQTLLESCRDEAHAAATVKAWLMSSAWAPLPADLVAMSMAFPEEPPKFDRCRLCANSGIAPGRFLITWRTHGGGYDKDPLPMPQTHQEHQAQWAACQEGQEIVEISDWCKCGFGQWKRQRDAEYRSTLNSAVEMAKQKQIAARASQIAKADFKSLQGGRG